MEASSRFLNSELINRHKAGLNGQLVEKATTIISNLGANVMGPDEARKKLGLKV